MIWAIRSLAATSLKGNGPAFRYTIRRARYVDADHAQFKQEFSVSDASVVTFRVVEAILLGKPHKLDLR